MWVTCGVVLSQAGAKIVGDAGIEVFERQALEDVDVDHGRPLGSVPIPLSQLIQSAYALRASARQPPPPISLEALEFAKAGLPSRSPRSGRRLVGGDGLEPPTLSV